MGELPKPRTWINAEIQEESLQSKETHTIEYECGCISHDVPEHDVKQQCHHHKARIASNHFLSLKTALEDSNKHLERWKQTAMNNQFESERLGKRCEVYSVQVEDLHTKLKAAELANAIAIKNSEDAFLRTPAAAPIKTSADDAVIRDLQLQTRLADAIRKHRDMQSHNRCWLDDLALYSALDEPIPAYSGCLPEPKQFLQECLNFCFNRAESYFSPADPLPSGIYRRFDSGQTVKRHGVDEKMTILGFVCEQMTPDKEPTIRYRCEKREPNGCTWIYVREDHLEKA